MKNIFSNAGYFLKETGTMIRLNLWSNLLSLFSTGLIFLVLAMIISGWLLSSHILQAIQDEAEISVYYNKNIDDKGAAQLIESIKGIAGVKDARKIGEQEAYNRMTKILGKDAEVLKVFDGNPFSAFIEVNINLNEMDHILKEINQLGGIELVRDNRDILNRLRNISGVLRFLGYLVIVAVGISTIVIISHIIRLGIQNNRQHIHTLRLLGAPESFIAFPYLLEGLLLTLGGGILAASLAAVALKQVYMQIAGPLPFIPLLPSKILITDMALVVVSLSLILGLAGSLFGFLSAKSK